MAIQLNTIKNHLKARKQDISDVKEQELVYWANYIMDHLYFELQKADSERFIEEVSIIAANEVDLPADFRRIGIGQTGFYYVDNDVPTTRRLGEVSFGSSKAGFRFHKDKIKFSEVEGQQFLLRYMPKRTRFTALEDYFTMDTTEAGQIIVEDDDIRTLVDAFAVQYDEFDEDLNLESIDDFKFAKTLSRMLMKYRKTSQVRPLRSNFRNY